MTQAHVNGVSPPPDYEQEIPMPAPDPPAESFIWITSSEIAAPLPPLHWAVKGLQLCPGRPGMVAGYGASGKTLLNQDLALSFAARLPVWGEFSTGRGGRVRHIDHEQGRYATIRRYQRLALGRGIDIASLGERLAVSTFPEVYLNSEGAYDIYARSFERIELVILDALRGATPGEDENDSKIRVCVDTLTRVSEATGTTFVVIHHAGKPKEGHADARTVARGSSAIFDACGCVFIMSGEKGAPKLMSQQKTPAEAEGGAIEDFYLEISDFPSGNDPSAGVRVAYRSKEEAKAVKSPKAEFLALVEKIYQFIKENPGVAGGDRISAMMRLSAPRTREAVKELIEKARVVNTGSKQRPRLYVTGEGS